MAQLPTGTVTLLFTDIEGSTWLWETHTTAMRAALTRHDALLRHCIEDHDGHVFKTGGDRLVRVGLRHPIAKEFALQIKMKSFGLRLCNN